MNERQQIKSLLTRLNSSKVKLFPAERQRIAAPDTHGVYLIRSPSGRVVHVGRTVRGHAGLAQRLTNHLRGQSSFTIGYLRGNGDRLRQGYTFQFIVVRKRRSRALLEHAATAWHCPAHLGLGVKREALARS